jgi:esterase/lipase superfamily enzyme
MASLRPDLPVCFVVHGSYNWWRDVVKESRSIQKWIRSAAPDMPVQIVFFTWPSDGNMPFLFPVDIAVLGRKASRHSLYLAHLIGSLPPEQPVCILGHSHGARAATAALHVLGGGAIEDGQKLPPGYSTPQHLRAVLVAAAIDQSWLNPGNRYGQALWPPERILLMRNSRDTTLAVYPYRKFGGEKALGKDGLTLQDRFQMDQLGRKIVELDAAQFAQSNHSFADYHQHPELAAAIVPYVYFRDDAMPVTPSTSDPSVSQRTQSPTKNGPVPTSSMQVVQPARPITPAGNQVPANGPRLTPASLNPQPKFEAPPVPADPAANDEPLRIQPKSKPAGRDGSASDKEDRTARKKWKNPFHLRVEP